MQRLEVSGAVRLIYRSLGVKGVMKRGVVSKFLAYLLPFQTLLDT